MRIIKKGWMILGILIFMGWPVLGWIGITGFILNEWLVAIFSWIIITFVYGVVTDKAENWD